MSLFSSRSSKEPYELLLRYLDGALSETELEELNRCLRADQSLRRDFALLLMQELHLSEIGQEESAGRAKNQLPTAAVCDHRRFGQPLFVGEGFPWGVGAAAVAGLILVACVWFSLRVLRPGYEPYIAKIDGIAVVKRGEQAKAAIPGIHLRRGDQIQLQPGSVLTVRCRREATLFHLSRGADVRLDWSPSGKVVFLEAGALTAMVAPQPKTAPMQIVTAEAKATVVGTELTIQEEERATRLEVWNGQVRLARLEDGKSIGVSSGQMAVARTGSDLIARAIPYGTLCEYWTELPGAEVKDLTGNPRFPDQPTARERLATLELAAHHGDSYGARLRAYLRPRLSGRCQFWIAADDAAELWISRDDDPAHKNLVCQVKEWTGPRQWEKSSAQASIPLFLEAGRRYYVEVLYKQNAGADGFAVAWRVPGGRRELIRTEDLVLPESAENSKNVINK